MFLRAMFLIAAGCCTFFGADKVVGGPFAVNVTSRSASVVWIVENDTVTLKAAGSTVIKSPALRAEKSEMTGLQPNTRYDYEVAGLKGWFKTAPTETVPFRFVLYGDVRTRHDVHRRVIAKIIESGVPDLVLHSGDLVENGIDSALWANFFDIERALLRQTAFFPSLGNHERNSKDFYDYFQRDLPYYSFNWGNAHFTVMNSDINNVSAVKSGRDEFWQRQTRWLEEDLAAAQKSDFRFVVAHHAPFTAVERRQGDNPQMTALTGTFEKYHVTAGLFGHDHNYQHYLKNGVHYVVSGGGGAPLYDVNKPDPAITQKVVKIENFVSVSVDGKTAKARAISIEGKVLDEWEFRASAAK
ncbi:MAG: metallophosphoesterase [Candidatus Solibacter sp.]|nr:metallophosphoesterase [Candidatus Solibacter sp.]